MLRRAQLASKSGFFHPFQTVGLRFAAAFSHRFGEVGEQYGKPQPDTHGGGKSGAAGEMPAGHRHGQQRGYQATRPDDEHHRVAPLHRRAQFFHCIQQRLAHQRRLEQG